jgi:hypothetical protein
MLKLIPGMPAFVALLIIALILSILKFNRKKAVN